MSVTIRRVSAFEVNLMDGKGSRLMTLSDVHGMIDDALGAVVDDLSFGGLFSGKEKVELFKRLEQAIPKIERVIYLRDILQEAVNGSE